MFRERENTLTESGTMAETQCRQALAKSGFAFGHSPVSFHWSQLVNPQGDKQSAVEAYKTLLSQEPESKSALEGLAYLYQLLGMMSLSAEYRRKLRELEARDYGIDESHINEVASYLQARTGEAEQPDQVPLVYTRSHFDRYADSFEQHLTGYLKYSGPSLVKSKLNELVNQHEIENILDLGCGTGLLGVELKGQYQQLDGVDISENMLDKARQKACYQNLFEQDIASFFNTNKKKYSVIAALDVFIYSGTLEDIFKSAYSSLNPNGLFIFTIENSGCEDFRLRNTGRYQHSPEYIDKISLVAGFVKISMEPISLRLEEGQPIDSSLFVFTKPTV